MKKFFSFFVLAAATAVWATPAFGQQYRRGQYRRGGSYRSYQSRSRVYPGRSFGYHRSYPVARYYSYPRYAPRTYYYQPTYYCPNYVSPYYYGGYVEPYYYSYYPSSLGFGWGGYGSWGHVSFWW